MVAVITISGSWAAILNFRLPLTS